MKYARRLLAILLATAFLVGPFGFVTQTARAQPTGSDFISDLVPADKLLPDGLISEENREELEKSFKKGVAACAIMTYIMFVIDSGSFKVPVSAFATELKENFIDCIMYHVVNVLIEDMLRSLTVWVQGGFKGNPVFVTRLNGYIRNLADQVAGEFLGEYGPLFCSPFRAQIRLQLLNAYKQSRGDLFNPSCTFTQSLDNIQRFVDGDFRAGGWNSWLEMWSDPSNNPYGAYIESLNELSLRISAATGEATLDINLGNGFLSRKRQTCYAYSDGDMTGPPQVFTVGDGESTLEARQRQGINSQIVECDDPEIVTPGQFIEEQINEKYGSPGRRLEMADEMNELINAVVLFLVGNIFKDEDGLSGYSFSDVGPVDLLDPSIDDNVPDGGGGCATCDGVDDVPPGPPGPDYTFQMQGSFRPTEPQTEGFYCELNPPTNVHYDRIQASWDMRVDNWDQGASNPQAFRHDFFELFRGRWRDNFGYVPFEQGNGSGGDGIILRHGVDLEHGDKARTRVRTSLPTGTYHADYLFDAKAGVVRVVITKPGGEVVTVSQTMQGWPGSGTPARAPLSSINTGNRSFYTGFSNFVEPVHNPAEAPSYGVTFSNLVIEFEADDSGGSPVIEQEPCTFDFGRGVGGPEPEDGGGGGGGGDTDDDDEPLF
jgi:hypothetical protein